MGLWRNWERNCFASRRLRVRVPSRPPRGIKCVIASVIGYLVAPLKSPIKAIMNRVQLPVIARLVRCVMASFENYDE